MKLKNVSKLLLFFITTIILSCSQDDPNENFKQESIKTSFVNFEKLYSVDNVFQNAFNSLIVNNKNTSGVTAKSNLKKIYGFTIANDPIKIVEKNGRLSYNIALQPKTVNLNIFENIVLNVDKNGNQNALHITYFRTSANHHEGNFKGFAKVKLLTNSNSKNTRTSSDCYTIEFIYCANADGVTHFAGQGDCEAQPQRYIACFSHDQSGGSTTETIDFNSISFVPSNYESPGGNSDSFEPTYVSSPNEPKDPEGFTNDEDVDTTFFEFITKLSPEQQFFLFQNKTIFETVNEYLDKNKNPFGEYELKAVEFIKQLIDLARLNNTTFSFNNNLDASNSLSFNSVNELNTFLQDNNTNFSSSFENIELPSQQNNFTSTQKFKINLLGGVKVFIKFGKEINGKLTISPNNISSNLYGLNAFTSWLPNNNATSITELSNGNYKVTLYGSMKQNYTIPGFNGLTIDQQIRIVMYVDSTYGDIYESIWYFD
ncbi:hypothetical protein [Flavobacterium luminosum]|uniref:Lipoprotein n=1 Tax=Flavobacterium luminosum TaxID=2949086 RepID=A0ABT0TQQ9_9FLAO|nr:hypothetical protein [Flavobacterium sp. HXWNR70]MCL9809203.1 hypothetical protein [Flavobacterium sp. HXWNR70]